MELQSKQSLDGISYNGSISRTLIWQTRRRNIVFSSFGLCLQCGVSGRTVTTFVLGKHFYFPRKGFFFMHFKVSEKSPHLSSYLHLNWCQKQTLYLCSRISHYYISATSNREIILTKALPPMKIRLFCIASQGFTVLHIWLSIMSAWFFLLLLAWPSDE